jgi:hypothetical protein
MTIEMVRDLVVIIFGAVGTIFLIALSVLFLTCYQQMRMIQSSISETAAQLPKLVAESRQSLKTIGSIVSLISAISMGIDMVRKIFEMNKGGKANEQ